MLETRDKLLDVVEATVEDVHVLLVFVARGGAGLIKLLLVHSTLKLGVHPR